MRFGEWKFALGAYFAARIALSAWAFVIVLLFPVVAQNLDLFGAPVLAVFDLASGERFAYSRQVDGAALTFRAGDPGVVTDTQTGSVWLLREGRAISGEYAGRTFVASPYPAEEIFPYHGVAFEQNPFLSVWQRFDANCYVAIAERGYGTFPGDINFPPFYPAVIRLVGSAIGNFFVAGLIASNLALIVALVLLYRTIEEKYGMGIGKYALSYMLLFPTAFFLLSAYTEGLFLVAALVALRALEREKWLWVGFAIFCAILMRLQGIALFAPLAYTLWTTRASGRYWLRVVGGAIAVSGGVFYLIVRYMSGAKIMPVGESNFFTQLVPPWEGVFYAVQSLVSGKFVLVDALNLACTILILVVLLLGWRKMPLQWNLYIIASLLILTMRLVGTQPLVPATRLALTQFPIFALMGLWGREGWAQRAIVYPFVVLGMYLSAQFFLWGWVA